MPSLEQDEVVAGLLKKGFSEQSGGDHRYFRLMHEGKDTGIFTMTSRGKKKYRSLGNDLVTAMAKQVKLTTKEFTNLIKCPLSEEEYLALLAQRDEL